MIPLKDNVPTRNFPVVTIGLIVANVVVWFWEWKTGVNKEVLHYGYYPCTLAGPCDPRIVPPDHLSWYDGVFTSMFLHASWFHVGGNMLFLWIFGNNVEDSLGRVRPDLRHASVLGPHRLEHPERRREWSDCGGSRGVPRASADRQRHHVLLPCLFLLLARPPGIPLPRHLVLLAALGRWLRRSSTASRRRGRLLCPYRRLCLRSTHDTARSAAATITTHDAMDSVLTWLAVAAGVIGGLVVLVFLIPAFWNDNSPQIVSKEHEDTH